MLHNRLKLLIVCIVTAIAGQYIKAQTFNYAEVLQKSMFFYEAQRSGALPANTRVSWRANSALDDGKDVSHDLTGGWYDAGDHVKFGFPMAFSATSLAWGAIDFQAGYVAAGQLQQLKNNLRFVNDYFIKCHTAPNELWGQVGDGGSDHSFWGSAEIMRMSRPSFKIDATHPGSDLAAETAAAMAAASIVFATDDPAYSATLKAHAIQLYNFADTFRGVYSSSITAASGYYTSFSGFNDELVWGAIWLYRATGDVAYLNKAEAYYANLGTEQQSTTKSFKWTIGWDDKSYGCYVLLAKLTGKDAYKADAERNLDYWTDGVNGQRVNYSPGGLAFLDVWGSLRYSANAAFLALYYHDIATTPAKDAKYYNFAKSQINYILGSNPLHRSFVCGFGVNPPVNPHHRTNHGAWANNLIGPPANSRHILYGALVGGPTVSDAYVDDRGDFQKNEVACDYNALFSGALAKLTLDLGGTPLAGFPVKETPTDEFLIEAKFNANSSNFTEYSIWANNHTAWPARIPTQFKYRIFVDISEGLAAGFSPSSYIISANTSAATFTPLQPWNAGSNIYYTEITYVPGTVIWPGGQGESRKETQIRIALPNNSPAAAWNPANDWSNQGVDGTLKQVNFIPLYADGVLVAGTPPPSGPSVGVTSVTVAPASASVSVGSTALLTASVLPANASNKFVTWTSSNPAVATVDASGLVSGVAAGAATITAKTLDGGFTATSAVTVNVVSIPVSGVSVSPTSTSTVVGGTTALIATVAPSNASNKAVSWSSSDTSVATVNASGLVTGVSIGSATITVTTQSGSFTASAMVTVGSNSIPATGVTVTPATASVGIGASTTLTATVAPANASNKTVTWSSSSPAVATVNASGVVTGVTTGSATITATSASGGFTSSAAITVTGGGGGGGGSPCTTPTTATLPLAQNGAGDFCFVTSGNITFINSWNTQLIEINGVAFTNQWSNAMPARINGNYYIHYVANVAWAHLEVNGSSGGGSTAVTGVSVTPGTVSVAIGGTAPLAATVAPANASNKSVTWSSSNNSIATVNASGVVMGVAAGSATVTATTQDGGFTATSAVTVTNTNIPVTGVSVTPATATVAAGSTTPLTALVAPANATNKTVAWSSSAPAVATVSASGVVTGVSAGTATITVTAQGNFTASAVITVTGGGTGGTACANGTPITLSFAQNGAGDSCFVASGNVNFINSWNMQLIEINGVNYTNKWANSLPPRINGNYYIHYVATVPWAHLEINGN